MRDKRCTSPITDLNEGGFQEVIPDPDKPEGAKRIIFCTGKVYYDLADYRAGQKIDDTAIIRIEQVYPLHRDKLSRILERHPDAQTFVWCQEESYNMGARGFIREHLRELVSTGSIAYAGRDRSTSPATGSRAIHLLEQMDLVKRAFEL